MVDNSSLPVAVGNETFANDDIGGVKFPRVKATWGPDGTANDTDVATGKPLPAQIRSATGLIPIGEPTDAKNTATDTTSVTAISIWKQISASIQAAAASLAGTLTVGTHAVTGSGLFSTISGGSEYETVAASQTDQILGPTGGQGDYVEGLVCVVATAATSQVQIKDGNGSAITVLPNAVGAGVGTYYVPLGMKTVNGTTPGWKVTTAAGVSVIGIGDFT